MADTKLEIKMIYKFNINFASSSQVNDLQARVTKVEK